MGGQRSVVIQVMSTRHGMLFDGVWPVSVLTFRQMTHTAVRVFVSQKFSLSLQPPPPPFPGETFLTHCCSSNTVFGFSQIL